MRSRNCKWLLRTRQRIVLTFKKIGEVFRYFHILARLPLSLSRADWGRFLPIYFALYSSSFRCLPSASSVNTIALKLEPINTVENEWTILTNFYAQDILSYRQEFFSLQRVDNRSLSRFLSPILRFQTLGIFFFLSLANLHVSFAPNF